MLAAELRTCEAYASSEETAGSVKRFLSYQGVFTPNEMKWQAWSSAAQKVQQASMPHSFTQY